MSPLGFHGVGRASNAGSPGEGMKFTLAGRRFVGV